jgi:hypothetical protein
MAEAHGARQTLTRRTLRLGACLVLLCAVALAASPARASAPAQSSAAPKGPLPAPQAFRLQASNGYTLLVVDEPSPSGNRWPLFIVAYTKDGGVVYEAPATVTETSMQADLGDLGEISVSFQRSNRATSVRCLGKKIYFDSGNYVGTIVFHGEERYTSVEATTAPGDVDYLLGGICGHGFGGSSGRRSNAVLSVRNPGLGPQLRVRKSRPGAAALITASLSEHSNGISIKRVTGLRMPGDDFTYDRRLRTATVQPPTPFAGSARFDLGKKAGRRWYGDLKVDMPGRADVPLTGPLLRATLAPGE